METINTRKSKVITRSYTSDSTVTATSLPRSTFSNKHHYYFDGIVGRLYPAGHFDVLPKSQFSGVNSGAITMERVVTPLMPDLSSHSYNFGCSFRAVDRDYKETAAPSKRNSFSSTMHFPNFYVPELATAVHQDFINHVWSIMDDCGHSTGTETTIALFTNILTATTESAAKTAFEATFALGGSSLDAVWHHLADGMYFTSSDVGGYLRATYADTIMVDFIQYANSFNVTTTNPYLSFASNLKNLWVRWMDYFVGRGSLLDHFSYPIVRTELMVANLSTMTDKAGCDKVFGLACHNSQLSTDWVRVNEYYMRCWFAVWCDYFRQPMLEPLNSYMDYNNFDSNSLFRRGTDYKFTDGHRAYMVLTLRSVPYGEDRVTTAHCDDACRNVYAPIIIPSAVGGGGTLSNGVKVHTIPADTMYSASSNTTMNALQHGWDSVALNYHNPVDGTATSVSCPIPANIGNFLNNTDGVPSASTYALGLSLNNLRTAEILSRELKRRHYFGDSYYDVVRADYDCDVSDADVLRPHMLGEGGVESLQNSQNVATTAGTTASGEDTPAGARVACSAGNVPSDAYEGFAQETGVVFNAFYITQRVTYDPMSDFLAVRTYADMVRPLYASTNESIMHKFSINRHAETPKKGYGFEPYGNYYRTRLDEAHGKFTKEYEDYIALRKPKSCNLNYTFMHQVGLPLGYLADTIMLDGQYYVCKTNDFVVTHSLPAPVEVI